MNSGRLVWVTSLDRWEACVERALGHPGRARIVAGVLLAAWGFAPAALAAELSVTGPDACPDAGELASRVERSLGVALAESAPLRFDVVFEAPVTPDASYTARLRARARGTPDASSAGVTATRVIRARDCGRLGDAVGVAIALAIRSPEPAPSGATQGDPASSAVTSTRGSFLPAAAAVGPAPDPAIGAPAAPTDNLLPTRRAAAVGGADLPPSVAPRADEQPLSPVLAAFFLADSGSLPSAGVGLGLAAEVRTPRLAFRVQGALLFEQHVTLAASEGAFGADMSLVFGSASACWSPLGGFRANFAAFACAGWELGQLTAEGTGVDSPRRGAQLWTAPRLDGGVSWALGSRWLRGTLQLSALAPLKRDDFFLRDAGNVHRPPGAVGRLAIGVDIAFD